MSQTPLKGDEAPALQNSPRPVVRSGIRQLQDLAEDPSLKGVNSRANSSNNAPLRASRVNVTYSTTVSHMAVKRLPRNTRVNPKRVGWLIEEHSKERFEQIAARCGVSAAVFLERVVEHLETELTDRGLPSWWPETELEDGELDMPPD